MMFSNSENIESDLVGVLDLVNQVTQALRWAQRTAGVIVRCRKTINADLNASLQWSVPLAKGHQERSDCVSVKKIPKKAARNCQ